MFSIYRDRIILFHGESCRIRRLLPMLLINPLLPILFHMKLARLGKPGNLPGRVLDASRRRERVEY